MKLISNDIIDQQPIDPRFAFAKGADDAPMVLSDNLSPHFVWADFPPDTRSFALICIDPDVPGVADDVNQPGVTIAQDLPRVDFCHWALIDIPTTVTELATGQCANGVTPGGKRDPQGPPGSRQGLNDYTQFLASDPDLGGEYAGYDGPCPPWNDERLHHYVFTIYALSTPSLDLPTPFTGHQALDALQDHILDQAALTGTYTLFKK